MFISPSQFIPFNVQFGNFLDTNNPAKTEGEYLLIPEQQSGRVQYLVVILKKMIK